MGLKTVLNVIAWPFKQLLKMVRSPKFWDLNRQAAQELAASGDPLGKIVIEAVKEVDLIKAGEPDLVKHAEAFERIASAALAEGINWKDSALRAMINLVVLALRMRWLT